MLITNTWLFGLIFAAAASARVVSETEQSPCYSDSCSKALLQNADAAASFCKAFKKTSDLLPGTCLPPTFIPYPEYATPCFDNEQDISRVSIACDCLPSGLPGSLPAFDSGSSSFVNSHPQHSGSDFPNSSGSTGSSVSGGTGSGSESPSGADQEGGTSAGFHGAGPTTTAPIQPVVTTEIIYITASIYPMTTTIESGPTSSIRTIDSTLLITRTTTLTVCIDCVVALPTFSSYATVSPSTSDAPTSQSSFTHAPGTTIPVQNHPIYHNSTRQFGTPSRYPTASGFSGYSFSTSGSLAAPKYVPNSSGSGRPFASQTASEASVSGHPVFPSGSGYVKPSYSVSGSGVSHALSSDARYPYSYSTGYSKSIAPSGTVPKHTSSSSSFSGTVYSRPSVSASGTAPRYPSLSSPFSGTGHASSVSALGTAPRYPSLSSPFSGTGHASSVSASGTGPSYTSLSSGTGYSKPALSSGTGPKYLSPSVSASGVGRRPTYSSGTAYSRSVAASGTGPRSYTSIKTGSPQSYYPTGTVSGYTYSSGSGSRNGNPSGTAPSSAYNFSGTGSAPFQPSGTAYSKNPLLSGTGISMSLNSTSAYRPSQPSTGLGPVRSIISSIATPISSLETSVATISPTPTLAIPSSTPVPLTSACVPAPLSTFILQASGSGTMRDGEYVIVESAENGRDDTLFFSDDEAGASTFSITSSSLLTTLDGTQHEGAESANIPDARTDDVLLFFDTFNVINSREIPEETASSECAIADGVLSCTTGVLNTIFYICDDVIGIMVGPAVPTSDVCHPLTLNALPIPGTADDCVISTAIVPSVVLPTVTLPSVTLPPVATSAPTASTCTDVVPAPSADIPANAICNQAGYFTTTLQLLAMQTIADGTATSVEECAAQCLADIMCKLSQFDAPNDCTLYSSSAEDITYSPDKDSPFISSDRECFTCQGSSMTTASPPALTAVTPTPTPVKPICLAVEKPDTTGYFCHERGYDLGTTYYQIGTAAAEEACASQCVSDENCEAYVYGSVDDALSCKLSMFTPDFSQDETSPITWSQTQCFTCLPGF